MMSFLPCLRRYPVPHGRVYARPLYIHMFMMRRILTHKLVFRR